MIAIAERYWKTKNNVNILSGMMKYLEVSVPQFFRFMPPFSFKLGLHHEAQLCCLDAKPDGVRDSHIISECVIPKFTTGCTALKSYKIVNTASHYL